MEWSTGETGEIRTVAVVQSSGPRKIVVQREQ